MSTGMASVASTFEQEVTTTCVRSLLRDSRATSRASSIGSTAFEEPTYTMQEVQREVLGLFSSDSPRWVAMIPHIAAPDSQSKLPHCEPLVMEQNPSLNVFQEDDIDHCAGGLFARQAAVKSPLGGGGVGLGSTAVHTGMMVWGDGEFNAAMN